MKYNVIYADPPWSYRDTQRNGGTSFFGASVRYPLMATEDICRLDVPGICDSDCALFLWATSPLLPDALRVMERWGFKYKTVAFVWSKRTVNGKEVANMGRWTMGNVEIVLLGVKGRVRRSVKNVRQFVVAERKRHSEKPDEVRRRIVELMGDVPRLEMFARKKTEGWDVFGNEVEDSITLPAA